MELICEELNVLPAGGRVQFTCVASSNMWTAFGANTGSIYMHSSGSLERNAVVVVADQPISQIAFNPTAELFAVSADRNVFIVRHNSSSRSSAEILLRVQPHDSPITCFAWDSDSNRVFSGSESGVVAITRVPSVCAHLMSVICYCTTTPVAY